MTQNINRFLYGGVFLLLTSVPCEAQNIATEIFNIIELLSNESEGTFLIHNVEYKKNTIRYFMENGTEEHETILWTDDQKFTDPEGIAIGTTYQQLIDKGYALQENEDGRKLIVLRSGWKAFFDLRLKKPENRGGTYPEIKQTDSIKMFQYSVIMIYGP